MQAYSFLISTWVNVQKYLHLNVAYLKSNSLYKYKIRKRGSIVPVTQELGLELYEMIMNYELAHSTSENRITCNSWLDDSVICLPETCCDHIIESVSW